VEISLIFSGLSFDEPFNGTIDRAGTVTFVDFNRQKNSGQRSDCQLPHRCGIIELARKCDSEQHLPR
jgi:hypothetical protein